MHTCRSTCQTEQAFVLFLPLLFLTALCGPEVSLKEGATLAFLESKSKESVWNFGGGSLSNLMVYLSDIDTSQSVAAISHHSAWWKCKCKQSPESSALQIGGLRTTEVLLDVTAQASNLLRGIRESLIHAGTYADCECFADDDIAPRRHNTWQEVDEDGGIN